MNSTNTLVSNQPEDSNIVGIGACLERCCLQEATSSRDNNQGKQNSKQGRVRFPWKLHQVLDDAEKEHFQEIIGWQPDGLSFKVHRPNEFVRRIMPRYFRQKNIRSFQRQLYHYNFSRIRDGPSAGAYWHPHFTRNNKSQCPKFHDGKEPNTISTIKNNLNDNNKNKNCRKTSYDKKTGNIKSRTKSVPMTNTMTSQTSCTMDNRNKSKISMVEPRTSGTKSVTDPFHLFFRNTNMPSIQHADSFLDLFRCSDMEITFDDSLRKERSSTCTHFQSQDDRESTIAFQDDDEISNSCITKTKINATVNRSSFSCLDNLLATIPDVPITFDEMIVACKENTEGIEDEFENELPFLDVEHYFPSQTIGTTGSAMTYRKKHSSSRIDFVSRQSPMITTKTNDQSDKFKHMFNCPLDGDLEPTPLSNGGMNHLSPMLEPLPIPLLPQQD